jgi:hypothetical protein
MANKLGIHDKEIQTIAMKAIEEQSLVVLRDMIESGQGIPEAKSLAKMIHDEESAETLGMMLADCLPATYGYKIAGHLADKLADKKEESKTYRELAEVRKTKMRDISWQMSVLDKNINWVKGLLNELVGPCDRTSISDAVPVCKCPRCRGNRYIDGLEQTKDRISRITGEYSDGTSKL